MAGAAARAIGVTFEAKTTATTGYLFQAFAFESIATVGLLPGGT